MKILIVTMSLPYPPASGGAIRVHGIVEGLKQAGHEVHLLCFADDTPPSLNFPVYTLPTPQRSKWQRLKNLIFTQQADIAGRFYDDAFANKLRVLITQHEYDIIQFEGIESICYQPIAADAKTRAKLIFDTFNAEYNLQRVIFQIDRKNIKRLPAAIYSYLQIRRIKRYEGMMCRMADAVIAVSDEDAALLRHFRDDQTVHVIPNGIQVARYTIDVDKVTLPGKHNIVFTGKMDYRPNVDAMIWFTEAILPHLPDVHLTIVGQQPHARLAHLNTLPNVTLTGWVDSVLPYLRAADVYIAPLRMGSGTRLKLLEAMACGCAIVATSIASSGLHPNTHTAMWIADDAQSFAEAIITLLNTPQKRAELGEIAKKQVTDIYDWSVLIPRLLAIYDTLRG
ncbi:MAG: glycosyltransferase [Phototrophicales bacterium]